MLLKKLYTCAQVEFEGMYSQWFGNNIYKTTYE